MPRSSRSSTSRRTDSHDPPQGDKMKIRQITPAIGAEITGVHLGDASRDPALFAQIKAALLRHKVLFFRKQDITRGDHEAFASCFGPLEDHPVLDSDPR